VANFQERGWDVWFNGILTPFPGNWEVRSSFLITPDAHHQGCPFRRIVENAEFCSLFCHLGSRPAQFGRNAQVFEGVFSLSKRGAGLSRVEVSPERYIGWKASNSRKRGRILW
jgi:hypothetical protein